MSSFYKNAGRILAGLCLLGAVGAQAQTLSMVSGNGQLVLQFSVSSPLVVLVRDASGNPVKNALVNWAITAGPGMGIKTSNYTDLTGQAAYSFNAPVLNPGTSYAPSTVVATYLGQTVSFVVTTGGIQNYSPYVGVAITSPTPAQLPLTGVSGQQRSEERRVGKE